MKRCTSVNASSVNIRPDFQKNLQAIGPVEAENAFDADPDDHRRMSVRSCKVKRCKSEIRNGFDIRPDHQEGLDATDLLDSEKTFSSHQDDHHWIFDVQYCIVKWCKSEVYCGVDICPGRCKNLDATDLVDSEKKFGTRQDDHRISAVHYCKVKWCISELRYGVNIRTTIQKLLRT